MRALTANWIIGISLFCLQACGGSEFQKPITQNETLPVRQAEPDPVPETSFDTVESVRKEELAEPVVSLDETPAPAQQTVTPPAPPPPPPGAIVKGSFTVYAEPSYPKPGQSYKIFVKVALPPGAGVDYQRRDLTIQVKGTDGYTDSFPQGFSTGSDYTFSVKGDVALASMSVPGADKNVKDAISCSSKVLNEAQQIDLVFGAKP